MTEMEEFTAPAPEPAAPQEKKKGKIVKRIVWAAVVALAAWLIYAVAGIYLSPDRKIQQVYLIPKDAALIIQTDEPVADWQRFSTSAPWLTLKQAPAFGEIAQSTDALDSLLQANRALLGLVGRREMMISLHKTRSNGWDFLIVVDLQKVSKMNVLKEQIEQIYKLAGQQVTERRHNGVTITELRDPSTRQLLYTAFIDNHFAASYNSRLIEAAIDEREAPVIGRDYAFIEVEKLVAGKGLCRIYVNYEYLPAYLSLYLGGRDAYVEAFSPSMSFAGLYGTVEKDRLEVRGWSLPREEVDPYVEALLGSGTQRIRAHEILPARTALYVNLGFDGMKTFMERLETALSSDNQELYNTYKTNRKRIENYFDLALDDDFLGWMSGEIAFAQSEPGLLGREPELILAVRATDIGRARKSMDRIEQRVKRRTPISIKAVEYKGYEINYVEMKGFFKIFFGQWFEKFETPYYTFVGDYVVFSTRSASLLSLVEDYEQGNLLKNDAGFKQALGRAEGASTVFAWIDMPKFYGQLPGLLTADTWNEIRRHREVLYSFPQWTFQVVDEGQRASLQYIMDYKPWVEPAPESTAEPVAEEEGEQTERELMSELKRFYVEQFEGNVLREFYPSGALQSEAEVKEGRRHGRYREYYESGALRLRGRYAAGQQRGAWKYYTEEGEFERKEKF